MATRERPGDRAATEARHLVAVALTEIRTTRRHLTMSMEAAAKRAGMSPSQYHRLESSSLAEPSIEQVCRAALLARPIRMQREVTLPIAGDRRAWDARIRRHPDRVDRGGVEAR